MPVVNVDIDEDVFLPCYRHLVDETEFFDIDFLYGGRDSGKSRHIAMQAVIECMMPGYFKCLLIRKVLNTVRDSQFNLIKIVLDSWNIRHLFSINETRMEIVCRSNGNGFYGRGLDKVSKIKSFANPSHCWIEEGNEITKDDFVVVLTTLRAEQRIKTWFSFNPECEENYTEFWLYQEWFSHSAKLSWSWTKTIEVDDEIIEFKARATHTTYRDNPYCKPQRKALYESYKNSKNNAYWYQTYTLGQWGYKRTGGEFWKCFVETQHTTTTGLKPGTIHITVDNNVHPYVTIGIWQIFSDQKLLRQVAELPCESPDNSAKKAAVKMVKWLDDRSYKDVLFIYGDPSANAKTTVDDNNESFFDKFIGTLQRSKVKVVNRVQPSAPEVALSGSFINEIYESNYAGWTIEVNVDCRVSIEDYVMAKEDKEGKILKKREKDKETGITFERYGHFSDAKRYFVTTVLDREFIEYKNRDDKLFGY